MESFKRFIEMPFLEEIIILDSEVDYQRLDEGKWISGRFDANIRIDQPSHGVGQQHAHVLARNGSEIGVVNFDGSGSHGTKFRLHQHDADALIKRGFSIKSGNIVEWVRISKAKQLIVLLEAFRQK